MNIINSKTLQTPIATGVIGFPITQSLSPIIHNFYLKKLNINGSYDKFEISSADFEKTVKNLIISKNLCGLNITIPHKERGFKLCDHLSQTAKNIGAINTIKILNNGKIFGHNSDAQGFINNLFNHYPDYNLKDKIALVFGAGGASRAIIYSLIWRGVSKIFIVNRTPQKALKIIDDFSNFSHRNHIILEYLESAQKFNFLNEVDLIINTTSLGMLNQEKLDIDISNAKKSAIVYDIVYKPLYTDLLNQALKLNLKIITGIGMLIEQALVGFEMWYGVKPKYDIELEKILLNKS